MVDVEQSASSKAYDALKTIAGGLLILLAIVILIVGIGTQLYVVWLLAGLLATGIARYAVMLGLIFILINLCWSG